MKETTRKRLDELLDELEEAAGAYEHGSTDDRSAIEEAKQKILDLAESLLPKQAVH